MAELNAPIFSFKGGVLGSKLLGRPDLKLYKEGILTGFNTITEIQGPQRFRQGDKFVKITRNNQPATFWPFIFTDDQAFALEFTDLKLRFFINEQAIVETATVITAISQANPGVINSVGHGYVTGDEVFLDVIVGMTELNGQFYYIDVIDIDNYSLKDVDGNVIDTTTFTAYVSGGTANRVYEIDTPYTQVEAESLKFDGIADIMYLVDGKHVPRKLIRSGNTNWSLETFNRISDPFDSTTVTAVTQANPAVVTVATAPDVPLITGDQVFLEDIVGMIELNNLFQTITVISPTSFSLDGVDSTAFTPYVSAGQATLAGNAPGAVGFFGSSLYYGGSENDPDVFWKSRSPDTTTGAPRYDDFTVGADPEDSVTLPIQQLGDGIARIRWFIGTRSFLAVGMFGGITKINGGADNVPVTVTDIGSFPIDAFGVSAVTPSVFGTDIIYTQKGNENILNFQFSLINDGFESFDTMVQNDEISRVGIRQVAFQQSRPALLWVLLNDGDYLSLTYKRSEGVAAWNTHRSGGTTLDTEGVISMCRQPQLNNEDRLWKCVKRIINSVARYYVEVSAENPLIPQFKDFFTGVDNKESDRTKYLGKLWEVQKRLIYLDSALELDTTQQTTITPSAVTGNSVTFTAGASIFAATDIERKIRVKLVAGDETGIARIIGYTSPTIVTCQIQQDFANTDPITAGNWYFTQKTVENLEHLEGELVRVIEDGGASPDKLVTNGKITLEDQATYAIIGEPYVGIVQTMPVELLLSAGITSGKYKTTGTMKFLVKDTVGVSYGNDIYSLKELKFRTGDDVGGRAVPLFSGWIDAPAFDDYDIQKSYYFVQTRPFPFTIQSMVFDTEVPFGAS